MFSGSFKSLLDLTRRVISALKMFFITWPSTPLPPLLIPAPKFVAYPPWGPMSNGLLQLRFWSANKIYFNYKENKGWKCVPLRKIIIIIHVWTQLDHSQVGPINSGGFAYGMILPAASLYASGGGVGGCQM